MSPHDDYFLCPHCSAEVPVNARFCRHCGATDESGWSEFTEGAADGYDDEYDDFDYDEYVQREWGGSAPTGGVRRWATTLLILLIVVTMFWMSIFGF